MVFLVYIRFYFKNIYVGKISGNVSIFPQKIAFFLKMGKYSKWANCCPVEKKIRNIPMIFPSVEEDHFINRCAFLVGDHSNNQLLSKHHTNTGTLVSRSKINVCHTFICQRVLKFAKSIKKCMA